MKLFKRKNAKRTVAINVNVPNSFDKYAKELMNTLFPPAPAEGEPLQFKSDPVNPYEAVLNSSFNRIISRCKMQGISCKECPFYVTDAMACAAKNTVRDINSIAVSPAEWESLLRGEDINIGLS